MTNKITANISKRKNKEEIKLKRNKERIKIKVIANLVFLNALNRGLSSTPILLATKANLSSTEKFHILFFLIKYFFFLRV